ncbi:MULTISPECIES: hypothetical protein [Enterovibrio]|uniref:Uncharacterized protein n=2 Tax=Enterovibrio norvegicus TaxID=188144 RepID=A0A1I5JF90_9GAMM|nr:MULTISPECIES: hypothetical protein [Enterovibrio]SFO71457.1 hypothetical protein SAMN03084138_00157 [Enterovibrio norvegicus DSM 15893]
MKINTQVNVKQPSAFTIRNHSFNKAAPSAFTIRNHSFSKEKK